MAYVGFGPFEIGMNILGPIAVLASFTGPFGWVATVVAVGILVMSFALKWVPVKKPAGAMSS